MARVRHVFNTDAIAHRWVYKQGDDARNAQGNFFFTGMVIFSYGKHFPIAMHVENSRGERAIHFTTAKYSITTAKHISLTSRAIPSSISVFHVEYMSAYRQSKDLIGRDHEANLKAYQTRVSELADKAKRARQNKPYLLSQLQAVVTEANRFCAFWDLPVLFTGNVGEFDLNALAADIDRARAEERTRERARQAKQEADAQEAIAMWLAGEQVYLPYGITRAYLRVKGDTVQTSRGAEFPIRHAARGLALVESIRSSNMPYSYDGRSIHLGHYRIDSIDVHGNVKAGCHYVLYEDIARIAGELTKVSSSVPQLACVSS